MDSEQEKRMTQYLLGRLPEHEEAEMERRYLADDSLFGELLGVEDDLRDAYERGELSAPDREAFEQRLLALPRQKEKQESARALRQYLLKASSPARPLTRRVSTWDRLLRALGAQPRMVVVPALSAALAILIVGGWWLGHRSVPRPTTGPRPGQGPEAVMPTIRTGQQSGVTTFAIVLTPGLVRGSEKSKPVVIPPEASTVRLEARFEGNYPRYQALLETVEGKKVWSEGTLQAQTFPGGERIFLDLSSSLLAPGDYILTVRGLPAAGNPETVAEYAFRVVER
jgi:hypothetical protein